MTWHLREAPRFREFDVQLVGKAENVSPARAVSQIEVFLSFNEDGVPKEAAVFVDGHPVADVGPDWANRLMAQEMMKELFE